MLAERGFARPEQPCISMESDFLVLGIVLETPRIDTAQKKTD